MVTISRREKVRKAVGYSFLYLFLIALGAVFVFPYVFMISRGLMTAQRAEDVIMHFFPDRVMFSNYIHAFSDGGYGMPLVHSLWLSALNAFAVPFSSLLAAYAFTRLNWIGKKFIFAFMLGTVMLPGVVTQVPLYVMYNDFGMLNTYLPLFLPNLLFGGAMNVFLARQFMLSQPAEVFESASIDGAGAVPELCDHCDAPLQNHRDLSGGERLYGGMGGLLHALHLSETGGERHASFRLCAVPQSVVGRKSLSPRVYLLGVHDSVPRSHPLLCVFPEISGAGHLDGGLKGLKQSDRRKR